MSQARQAVADSLLSLPLLSAEQAGACCAAPSCWRASWPPLPRTPSLRTKTFDISFKAGEKDSLAKALKKLCADVEVGSEGRLPVQSSCPTGLQSPA